MWIKIKNLHQFTVPELTLKEVEDIKNNLSKLKKFDFVLVDARINLSQ